MLAEIFAFFIMAVLVAVGPKRAVPLFLIGGGAFTIFTIGALAIVGGAAAIALQTAKGRGIWTFFSDAKVEVRKVVWPSRQETIQTTLIVFLMVILVGIILWLLDIFLLWAVKLLTGQGG